MATGLIFGGVFISGCVCGFLCARRMYRATEEDYGEAAETRAEAAVSIAARSEQRLDRIVSVATEVGQITRADVANLFCISERTADMYIRRLVRLGMVRRKVVDGAVVYVVPGSRTPKKTPRKRTRKTTTKATKQPVE